MKKTLLALVVAGFVLAGCDQKASPESAAQPASETATVVEEQAVQTEGMTQVENKAESNEAEAAQPADVMAEGEQDEMKAGESSEPVADMEHNARNSLDWAGTYTGILPCADCEGIKTELVIKDDGTFTLTEMYLGKDGGAFEHEGTFNWNTAGNTIALPGISDSAVQYFVGENQLFRLDLEGNRITGDLESHYILKKQ
ncbi:copper resistance protein NlpE [Photobacterium ganghwense]|uniref:copper resistance protein NlpE n=1 Tax=Photobacterium ganghwense TaxID=320778 RepID=UPI0039EF29BD